ncbi:elongation factor P-like protein EfpL [Methylovulum psychrotolerans]|uniref:Elongation factor P-like protein n=1 Tax=Methylovulum psychrotolerans TaxID=1704499 RepID=A0A2S5CLC6_9GAMM|nr:elongation factor P-like protein YeiP [Methylovulum psychrotolerans]POZ51588.1 elongation factor P-like protein YeiP [Methylovulum psychrotolerans]
MAKASDLKRGMVVEINGVPHIVKHVDVKSPSSRGANTLYKVRFNNMKTGLKLDESLKGDDTFKDAELVRAKVQYSYKDGDNYIFMNAEDYSQYTLAAEDLEGQVDYLTESLEGIVALLIDDEILGIELPATVILEIIETPPPIKGSSASARTKTARLSTGLEVQVPEYLETGELIKVNTETGKYSSRA